MPTPKGARVLARRWRVRGSARVTVLPLAFSALLLLGAAAASATGLGFQFLGGRMTVEAAPLDILPSLPSLLPSLLPSVLPSPPGPPSVPPPPLPTILPTPSPSLPVLEPSPNPSARPGPPAPAAAPLVVSGVPGTAPVVVEKASLFGLPVELAPQPPPNPLAQTLAVAIGDGLTLGSDHVWPYLAAGWLALLLGGAGVVLSRRLQR